MNIGLFVECLFGSTDSFVPGIDAFCHVCPDSFSCVSVQLLSSVLFSNKLVKRFISMSGTNQAWFFFGLCMVERLLGSHRNTLWHCLLTSFHPAQATNEVISRVPKATQAEMEAAVNSCAKTYSSWSETSILSRQQIFLRYQQLIKDNIVRMLYYLWILFLTSCLVCLTILSFCCSSSFNMLSLV